MITTNICFPRFWQYAVLMMRVNTPADCSKNANQLFVDGHVDGKSTFTIRNSNKNSLDVWAANSLKEISLD
ncbi:MAG: hypothetical protein E7058_08205 [Lentisphaerae bacterium]|nr:hypothetical protein [Lentisphaerota bacterium]